MKYLGAEYQLEQVPAEVYVAEGLEMVALWQCQDFEDVLRLVTKKEDPALSKNILAHGDLMLGNFGLGGEDFCFTACVGLAALRITNPVGLVPSIQASDWNLIVERLAMLQADPTFESLDQAVGFGLQETSIVNEGYIEGFHSSFGINSTTPDLGFRALGTLVAHDLMHFASISDR